MQWYDIWHYELLRYVHMHIQCPLNTTPLSWQWASIWKDICRHSYKTYWHKMYLLHHSHKNYSPLHKICHYFCTHHKIQISSMTTLYITTVHCDFISTCNPDIQSTYISSYSYIISIISNTTTTTLQTSTVISFPHYDLIYFHTMIYHETSVGDVLRTIVGQRRWI
jgi:hypothetical protein